EVRPLIDWGVATLALAGEAESGDLHLVKPVGRGVLVAAVDGLGHGAEAAAAARTAVTTLDRHADEFLIPVVRKCHEALIGRRGAATARRPHPGASREGHGRCARAGGALRRGRTRKGMTRVVPTGPPAAPPPTPRKEEWQALRILAVGAEGGGSGGLLHSIRQ